MAEPIDKLEDLAEVYAIALFELARKADLVEQVREELELLVQLEKSAPDFAAFLSSGSVDDDRRAASLEHMFGLLRVLLRQYVLQQEKALDQVEVIATSAVELGGAQRKEIEVLAAELAGRTPLVEFVVEPALLGGLILQIGDWRYDNSLRTRLKVARGQLLEHGDRGLEVGVASSE
jgi:F0F1-type ATP synthase delta subunit